MQTRTLAPIVLLGSLVACGEESFCDRADCDEATTSSGTAASGASGSTGDAASTASSSGSGDGGSGGGGTGASGPGGGGAGPFDVTPGDTKVGVLRALDFDATTDVTWSVVEDDGGTIDEEGVYVSPDEPGVFHVVATAAGGDEVELEVTVVGLTLEVAGGVPGGPGNLDGIPSRARFASPRGLGTLDSGSFVIADTGNHTVRIFLEDEGEVRTLAGSPGVAGTSNGVAGAARFDGPTGVVVDAGIAYVVDHDGTCVRRVGVETGDVTTLSGTCGVPGTTNGSGATARFDAIDGIVLDPRGGGLFVCQTPGGVNDALRLVDLDTGATTTVAAGEAEPNEVCTVALAQGLDSIFISSDWDTRQIGAYNPSNAAQPVTAITEMPGQDDAISGLAFDDGDDVLFAIDRERPGGAGTPWLTTLHAFDLGDDAFIEIAGGANDYVDGPLADARFLTPGFLVGAPNGDLLLSDVEGHTIRRVDLGGIDEVETVLGSPATIYARDGSSTTARLLAPFHVALAENDDAIFVAGAFPDNVIRRIDASTRAVARFSGVPADYVLGSPPGFDAPVNGQADEAVFGAILDLLRVGDALYVIDTSSAVRRVSVATGAVSTFAGALGQSGQTDGTGAAARFDFATDGFAGGLATDGVDLFVADPGNFAIRRVELATGEVTTIAGGTEGTADGIGDEAQFRAPAGLAFADGVLYVADAAAHTIRAVDVASGEVTTLAGRAGLPGDVDGDADAARFAAPFRLAADGIGNLYVTSLGLPGDLSHTIRRIRLADAETVSFAGDGVLYGFADGPLPATVGCPAGLAVDGAGDLVFADACDGAIGAIRPL